MEKIGLIGIQEYSNCLNKTISLSLPWNKLQNKSILVVGAAGLIGSYLIDVLVELNKKLGLNCKIIALGRNIQKLQRRFSYYKSNKLVHLVEQDITKEFSSELEKYSCDFVIHLASNTHPIAYSTDPIGTIMTNVDGTDRLLDFAVRHNVERFIYASSVEIYGENVGDVEKFSEDYCGYLNCNTLRAGYPEGKRVGEALCQAYRIAKNIEIVIPRFSRTYGPTMLMSDTKAISQFIKNAVEGKDIVLKSAGTQFYSYSFVTDAVNALFYCLFFGKDGDAYNVSDSSSDISLKDLAQILSNISKTKVIFELPSEIEKAGYSKATKAVLDSQKLKLLGWKSIYPIQLGLETTVQIMRQL